MKLSGQFKCLLSFFLFLSFFFLGLFLGKEVSAQSETRSSKPNLLAQNICVYDAECSPGYVCMNGQCVAAPTLPPPPPPPTTTPPPPPPSPIPPGYDGRARPRYQTTQLYPFPCNRVAPNDSAFKDQEFHSLRPYQASPCNQTYNDLALYCGNDLIISDPITILKTFAPDFLSATYTFEGVPIEIAVPEVPLLGKYCFYCSNGHCVGNLAGNCIPDPDICEPGGPADQCSQYCVDNGDGTEDCTFNVRRVRNIAIDLQKAYLPIMGFTEPSVGAESRPDRVINSILQSETMDDAKKVNEYVSWYLNGVIGRAEYPPPNPDTDSGRKRIIDYSGPLKRLLSWANQAKIRIDEIGDAYRSVQENAGIRHNQVIGCVNSAGEPTRCYPRAGGGSQIRMTTLRDRLPPLPWNYDNFRDFLNDYVAWTRRPLTNLFSYVPFSSTENRLGRVEIGTYSIQPPLSHRFRILGSAITNQRPAALSFAHMQEGSELAQILQGIFAYEGADLDARPEPAVVSTSRYCDLRAIRSNPGDDLFAGEITATVTYDVQVTCEFAILDPDIPGNLCRRLTNFEANCFSDSYYCEKSYRNHDCESGQQCGVGCAPPPTGQPCESTPALYPTDPWDGPFSCFPGSWGCTNVGGGCPNGYICADEDTCSQPYTQIPLTQTCTNNVQVAFRTISETPLATDIWKRLVANNVSVFRRIFPKIEDEEGRPIRRLWDIAAATGVIYEGEGVVVAGNPSVQRPANQGELYFPHIGGIHEYFLKCIQKTLRPQGYGEGCLSGPEPLTEGISIGECGSPPPPGAIPPGGGYCQLGTGYCSPSYLGQWFSGCHARQASIVCNVESGGNPSAMNCGCLTGRTLDYSIGLFQINLLAHCAGAFEYGWGPPPWCTILDQGRVDACAERFFNPEENAAYAAQLSKGGTNWTPWSAYTVACRDEVDAACQ